ncbi:MAG: preprotein translocase subunit SecG [Clostridiales bacterium]|nr:preprotein translocase subunit SecG [Clostridiales bacterium]
MSTVQLVINILLVVAALVLIVSVLLQKGEGDAMGAIMGGSGADSFLGRNKAKTMQGKLANVTKIAAGVFVSLALVMIFLI